MDSRLELIKRIIIPETQSEERIIIDSRFVEGAFFGKPRSGHPEGGVIYHVGDVLDNVNKYGDASHREKLRFIAIVHDSFKYLVDRNKPRTGENNHAVIARHFAEEYTNDLETLGVIELHDHAYNIWRKCHERGKMDRAERKARALINRLGSYIDLFLLFYQCDNHVRGKERDHFLWFSNLSRELWTDY